MTIYNETKTTILENPDLNLGYLRPDTLTTHHDAVIKHHEAVTPVEEQGHYETIAEYPNGGKDVEWVVDVQGVKGQEAYDEVIEEERDDVEEIQIYIPYTVSELHVRALQKEKSEASAWLSAHDYIGTKIATGRATIEEYATEIAEMTRLAERINAIETELAGV